VRVAEVEIRNRLGLHARAAAKFVHLANRFGARIQVLKGDATVDGKSILGLLTLAAARGTRLRLVARGDDADDALEALSDLIAGGFGEDDGCP